MSRMPFELHSTATPYERAAYVLAADLDRWPWEHAQTLGLMTRFAVETTPFGDLLTAAVTPPENGAEGRVRVVRESLCDLILWESGADAYRPTLADALVAVHAVRCLLTPATGILAADGPRRVPGAAWWLWPTVVNGLAGITVEQLQAAVRGHVFDPIDACKLLYNGRTLRSRLELRFPPEGGPARYYA